MKAPQGSVITGAQIMSAHTNRSTHYDYKEMKNKWDTEEQMAPDFPSYTNSCSLL